MSERKKVSAVERQKKRTRRHAAIVLICIVLVAALAGGTYGITRLLVHPKTGTAVSSSAVSKASTAKDSSTSASSAAAASSAQAFEVNKTGLTGYQALYPDLYAKTKVGQWKDAADKTVYLTFDDGPSDLTPQLLEVLKKNNVKAAFFITHQPEQQKDPNYDKCLKEIYDSGCTCAVHSACHNYRKIYASPEAYLSDFNNMYQILKKATNDHVAPFFRFPGGSNNPIMSTSTRKAIIQEMTRRGFFFYDWDVDSKDAQGADASGIYANSIRGMQEGGNIILMHNTSVKKATLSEVENIIQYGKQNGYTFKPLDGTLDPSMYGFSNQYFIPLLKGNPNFKLSTKHEARFASLLNNGTSVSGAGVSSAGN
jgi:peptidoglycan/xylan/chitin deacetylase (PgdA/CDA1 family)